MTTTTIVIISLSWIIPVIGYIIYNLYQKNIKLEKIAISQSAYILSIQSLMDEFDRVARQIDDKIWVQSDPEFLALFNSINQLQEASKKYRTDGK